MNFAGRSFTQGLIWCNKMGLPHNKTFISDASKSRHRLIQTLVGLVNSQ